MDAVTAFPSCLAAEYCLERDRVFFFVVCLFFDFCTNGTLATSPVAADLCPGWGMKGFPVLCESNSALPRGKQRSALGHGETYSFSIGTWLLLQF